jgi:MFS family permease
MNRGQERPLLQALGLVIVVTYAGMTLTHSIPWLFVLSFVNGVAWGFWPILFTVPFHLPGIRPREVAVAVSFTMMMSSGGTALGPLVAGFIQELLSDIQLSLMITSFFGLSLTVAGLLLPFGPREGETEGAKATQGA